MMLLSRYVVCPRTSPTGTSDSSNNGGRYHAKAAGIMQKRAKDTELLWNEAEIEGSKTRLAVVQEYEG